MHRRHSCSIPLAVIYTLYQLYNATNEARRCAPNIKDPRVLSTVLTHVGANTDHTQRDKKKGNRSGNKKNQKGILWSS